VFPASNILFLSPVLVAERNLYIPSIGMAAAAGWLLSELFARRRQTAMVAIAVVVGLMSLRTVTRNPVWNDTRGLFIDEIQRHPQSARAWFFHSDRLWREGMQAEARRAFRVLMLFTDSDYLYAVQVGSRMSAMDRASPRAAKFFLERAWGERPLLYTAPGMLAIHHLNHREFALGEAPGRAAVLLAPENPDLHRVLAGLLSGQGRPAEAIPYRLTQIAQGGGGPWTSWFFLAGDYAAVGNADAARAALDSARVRAQSPEAIAAVAALQRDLDAGPATPQELE
jgi:predicted Zn-dependent protease